MSSIAQRPAPPPNTPSALAGTEWISHRASAGLSVVALILLLGGALLWGPWPITVVDGDTVDRGWQRHRLVGFDAPEIRRAACEAERRHGLQARDRLAELLRSAQRVEMARTTWRLDRYGRWLSRLTIDGRDVAEIAIEEGWGRRYEGGKREGWC